MINFATLQGLSIPEGVVTQITDASGRVIWAVQNSKPVVLQVVKVTSNTYAGETTYNNEQFILLDIYPKTNGTVKVTYGGLTKTITDTSGAEEPNAQQVFFGTFNGVSDSVTTPASGMLTIEGGFYAFGRGTFAADNTKQTSIGCNCITTVKDFGGVSIIPHEAFKKCIDLIVQEIPEGVETIGDNAFSMEARASQITGSSAYKVKWTTVMEGGTIILPSTIKSIGSRAFASSASCANSSSSGTIYYPCYLAKVIILATEPPTLGENAFGISGYYEDSQFRVETFEVPKGCGAAYKAAEGWSAYANYIVEAT